MLMNMGFSEKEIVCWCDRHCTNMESYC